VNWNAWGISWLGAWGDSWGFVEVEEDPDKYPTPKKSVTGNDSSKVHIAQLYKPIQETKNTKLLQQDNDLIAILGFMVSSGVIA